MVVPEVLLLLEEDSEAGGVSASDSGWCCEKLCADSVLLAMFEEEEVLALVL